jgi:hypothetical protein
MSEKRKRAVTWGETPAFSAASLAKHAEGDGTNPELRALDARRRHTAVSASARAARDKIESGSRIGGKFQRMAGEVRKERSVMIRMDFVNAEILKLHSDMRRVHLTVLINDILSVWIGDATDYRQEIYKAILPPSVRAMGVPERYVGYRASLGARPLSEYDAIVEPKPEPAPVVPPPPPEEPVRAPEPVAMTPVVPPPVVVDDAVPAAYGWGSAAAAYTMGMTPGREHPIDLMERQQAEEVARLRAESAQSRADLGIPEELGGAKRDA